MTSTTFTVASIFALEVSFILLVILLFRIRKLKRLLSNCENECAAGAQTQHDKKIKKRLNKTQIKQKYQLLML